MARLRLLIIMSLVLSFARGWIPSIATKISRGGLRATFSSDRELLAGILQRAERTLAYRTSSSDDKNNSDDDDQDTSSSSIPSEIRNVLSELRQEIEPTRQQRQQDEETVFVAPPVDVTKTYGQNPAITSTALAHLMWRHVIRPGIDSAIDATAGNGGDSVVLAQMLFPTHDENDATTTTTTTTNTPGFSHLVSVDIQREACDNTRQELSSILSDDIMESRVQIVHASHAPLPLPRNASSPIALVVYNLGYLPNSSKEQMTQTDSTLVSLADAILHLRVGGLLSVMTYPRSNAHEDFAVHCFLEGLALFSSVTHDWRDCVKTFPLPGYSWEQEGDPRTLVLQSLERIWEKGSPKQTWRVHEHRKLGWTDAPILLTAVRIK